MTWSVKARWMWVARAVTPTADSLLVVAALTEAGSVAALPAVAIPGVVPAAGQAVATPTDLVRKLRSAVRRWRMVFRAWREENAKAHATAKPTACCSAPPPGGNQKRESKS